MADARDEALREAHELLGKVYALMQRGEVTLTHGAGGGCWALPDQIGAWLEAQDAARSSAANGGVSPSHEVHPVAWVPIHPRNGPLWSMTTDKPDAERLPGSYPLRSLVFAAGAASTPAPIEWAEVVRIADTAEVHEALTNFAHDTTGDNGEMVVRAVLAAARGVASNIKASGKV